MVAVPSAVAPNPRPSPRQSPTRSPSFSSDRDNGVGRRPREREIKSRYMSSFSSTTSSSSPGNPSVSRKSLSPSRTSILSVSSTAIPSVSFNKRSHSVGRRGPSTPRSSNFDHKSCGDAMTTSSVLYTTTRSLSVSFQGEPFSLHVCKSKPSSYPSPNARRILPERRRTPARGSRADVPGGADLTENSRSIEHSRWPGRSRQSESVSRNLDNFNGKKRLNNPRNDGSPKSLALNRSRPNPESVEVGKMKMVSASNLTPISTDAFDSLVSDSESISSGSTAERPEITCSANVEDREAVVPSRFNQDTNNHMKFMPRPGSPLSRCNVIKTTSSPKIIFPKKFVNDTLVSYPKNISVFKGPSNPLGHSSQPVSPLKLPMGSSFSPRRFPSPSRASSMSNMLNNNKCSTPFVLNSPTDVRRGKVLENRINDAHVLRLLYSRHMQWRFVNARRSSSRITQTATAEKYLYNAWLGTFRLFELVRIKRNELQLQILNLKLISILKGQVLYLEEWACLERTLFNSLRGAAEALTAGTLRLPVVSGAMADVQHVEDAIFSSVEVMQAMVSSVYSYLSKINKVHSLVANLLKVRRKEQILLAQCKLALSTISTIQVTDCSVMAQLLQQS